jgi:hypothetical protein
VTILFLSCGQQKQQNTSSTIMIIDSSHSFESSKDIDTLIKKVSTEYIPQTLIEFVKLNLNSLKIPTISDYKSTWKIYKDGNRSPFYCSSDFNADGKTDYALLLVNESATIELYAFLTQESVFEPVFIDSFGKYKDSIEVSIKIETKGLWSGEGDEVNTESDGIYVHFFEESLGKGYYFKNNKFQKFLFD